MAALLLLFEKPLLLVLFQITARAFREGEQKGAGIRVQGFILPPKDEKFGYGFQLYTFRFSLFSIDFLRVFSLFLRTWPVCDRRLF